MSTRKDTDLSLDDEIRRVEARIEARRADLIATAEDAKERVRSIVARPSTLVVAVALGFIVGRLMRPHRAPVPNTKGAKFRRFARGALGAGVTRVLPLAMGPLQGMAVQWLGRKFG